MANGAKGDDPVSDILDHGLGVYGAATDALVRELARFVPRYRLWDLVEWPWPPAPASFHADLQALLERLRAEARASGWELSDDPDAD